MLLNRPSLVLGMAVLFFFGTASAEVFSCPEKIETTSLLAVGQPGWQPLSDNQPQYFEKISLFAGQPDQMARLVPDLDSTKQVAWTLSAGTEYWMSCHYLRTNTTLVRRLPDNAKQCEVRVKPVGKKAFQQAPDLVCK